MELSVETQKIYAERDKALLALRDRFDREQAALQNSDQAMREDHAKQLAELEAKLIAELNAYIESLNGKFAQLQDAAATEEAQIYKDADTAVDQLAEAYQAELLAESEAAQQKAEDDAEALSDVNLWKVEMATLTVDEIRDDFRKVQVVAVAEHLGLPSSGSEKVVAERIFEALNSGE